MNEFQAKLILWLQHHWLTIVLVIISLAVAALLGWLIWRRYSSSLFAWWRELRRTPEIRRDALNEIWSEFWYQIPQTLRRRVRRYPVCLVLGDHHSGKTTLIRSQGLKDIEGVRFDSGLQDNPLMQVYLTNEEIIVELSARFLYSSTPDHTEALLAFCRKLPFDSRAVLVIDAHALMVSLEESQAALIDTLVGKLAQIGKVNDQAMPFALALTHMDQVLGFREFSDFTAEVGLPIRVTLKDKSPVADVTEGLSDYFDYLNNILVSTRTILEKIKHRWPF
jgi:type VI protein secretion system component VasK